MNYFSKNLKFLRLKKRINQQEIADDLKISRPTYTCWENGIRTPKIEQILDVANYFGVGMDIISRDYTKNIFATRLEKAIELSGYNLDEVSDKTQINKTVINNCLVGKYKPNSMNLQRFASTLNVSEDWLKGEDVDIYGNSMNQQYDEIEILYHKYKNILTKEDKIIIKTIIEQRIKGKDKQNGNISNK